MKANKIISARILTTALGCSFPAFVSASPNQFIPVANCSNIAYDEVSQIAYLAAGDAIQRYDFQSSQFLPSFSTGSPVYDVALSPDRKTIAVANGLIATGYDPIKYVTGSYTANSIDLVNPMTGAVQQLQVQTENFSTPLPGYGGSQQVYFINNNVVAVAGSDASNNLILRVDVSSKLGLSAQHQPFGSIPKLAISADCSTLGYCKTKYSSGQLGGLIDAATGTVLAAEGPGYGQDLAINRDGSQIAIVQGQGFNGGLSGSSGLLILNRALTVVGTITSPQGGVFSATATAYSPTQDLLYAAWSGNGGITVHDSKTLALLSVAEPDASPAIRKLRISDDGFTLFAISSDGVRVYSLPKPNSPAIIDPGFETPSAGVNNYNAFLYNPTASGWTFTSSAGVTGNSSGFTSANPAAPGGTQAAFIQNQGSISQNIVFPAGSYAITAQTANRANWGGQQTVLVYVDGQPVGTFQGGTAYSQVVTNTFTVTSGTHSIDFIGTATGDSTLFLDQIALVIAPVVVGNPGFESPNVGSGTYTSFQYNPATTPGVQDWTFSGWSGVTGNSSGFTSGNVNASEGTQVAFLQGNNAEVSQTLSFSKAGTYTLLVSSAQRGNWNEALQQANVYLDEALLGTFSPAATTYQTVTLPVPATQGTHQLKFKGTTIGDSTLFIDRVSLLSSP